MAGADPGPPPTGADVADAPAATVLADVPMAVFTERLMVNVDDVPGTVRITAEVDTASLSVPDLLAVLKAMEASVTRS